MGSRVMRHLVRPVVTRTVPGHQHQQQRGLVVAVDGLRPEVQRLHREVTEFVRERVLPVEQELRDFYEEETWTIPAAHTQLQEEAKAAGLWNLFLPLEADPGQRYRVTSSPSPPSPGTVPASPTWSTPTCAR